MAYPRFDRRAYLFLAASATILQAVCLFMIPLVYECDAAVYFTYSPARTYRAPFYPVFLFLTGQHLFHSFVGTVALQGVLGVFSSVLMYAILTPVSRPMALFASTVYVFSLVPFTAAKLMLAEQLFTFLVLVTIYAFARYSEARNVKWLYGTVALGLLAMFTRWEGQFLLLFTGLAMASLAVRRGGQLVHVLTSLVLVVAVVTGWSYARSRIAQDPQLFGSLQNGTGDQLFWRLYRYLGTSVSWTVSGQAEGPGAWLKWEEGFGHEQDHGPGLIFPEHGQSSTRLRDLIIGIARKRPTDDLFRGSRGGFLTELDGQPEKLAADIFAHPDDVYVFSVPAEIRRELGTREGERLLLEVSLEAIRHHPTVLLAMGSEAASFLGLSLKPSVIQGRPLNLLMAEWGEFHYANVPFDLGNCATTTLPPRMVDEYRWDQSLSRWRPIDPFVRLASSSRNWVRNVTGVLALLTWWFVPFSRFRLRFVVTGLVTLTFLAVYGVLGGGAQTRYEYAALPLLMITTAGGMVGIWRAIEVVRRRAVGPW